LSHGGNLAESGSLAIVRGPPTKTQKKTSEMMVNPDVDGCTKTLNHGNIQYSKKHKKQLPTQKQKNTKTEV